MQFSLQDVAPSVMFVGSQFPLSIGISSYIILKPYNQATYQTTWISIPVDLRSILWQHLSLFEVFKNDLDDV